MRIRRKAKGSVIAFSTVLALALVLLGVGFVFVLMYMGGQHETKNAVDAGGLNVGKQALDALTVSVGGPTSVFYDVTSDTDDGSKDPDGNASLRRINRVWAKAMLIGINADEASSAGQAGSCSSSAVQAHDQAKSISDALSQKLTTASLLYPFFTEYSKANSVRMIGSTIETDVLAGSGWGTALMDRTPVTTTARESNITLNGGANFGLPPNYSLNGGYITDCTRTPAPMSAGGLKFLKGYTPLNVAGNDIWQVPFQFDEKPRLVSQSVFDQSTVAAAPLSWDNAVPNAFSVQGQAVKAGASGEKASTWVLTNPRETFQMSMPHSFLKIQLDPMQAHWYFFPTGYPPIEMPGSETDYGYMITSGSAAMPQGGLLCSLVDSGSVDEIGADVVGRSLDDVIFGSPDDSGSTKLEQYMTNRVNEMISKTGKSYSASDMHSALGALWTRADLASSDAGKERDFYVYSKDGVNLSLVSDQTSFTAPLWLQTMISQTPEGTENKLVDDANCFAPMIFEPTATPDPFCTVDFTLGWGNWQKDLAWTPGTGYNGSLGTVRVKRWTNIYVFGVATPVF